MSVNRFTFFSTRQTTQILYSDKPLDIQSGSSGASWPFTITVPEYVDPDAIAATGIDQEQSYLQLSPNAVATQLLPPSFYESRRALGGFVEYYLQAKFQFVSQRKGFFSGRGKIESHEAIMPLRVEYISPEPPIADFQLKRHTTSQQIASQRLVPGMEDNKLSLSQKTLQILGSSKVPRLMFKIHLDVPTALQLENENHVPLNIRLEPIWSSTSDIIREVSQKFTVEHLVLRIVPATELRTKTRSFTYARKAMDLIAENRVGSLSTKIHVPLVAAGTYKEPEIVDIGKLLNFNLSRETTRRIAVQPHAMKLYPSFTTYNISHQYKLSWELRGVMTGEKIQLNGEHIVTLLPRSSPRQNLSTESFKAPMPYEKEEN